MAARARHPVDRPLLFVDQGKMSRLDADQGGGRVDELVQRHALTAELGDLGGQAAKTQEFPVVNPQRLRSAIRVGTRHQGSPLRRA